METIEQPPAAVIIGRNIRARRIEVGLSQKALAEMVAIAQTQLSRYERGVRKPCDERLQLISRILKTKTSKLRDED